MAVWAATCFGETTKPLLQTMAYRHRAKTMILFLMEKMCPVPPASRAQVGWSLFSIGFLDSYLTLRSPAVAQQKITSTMWFDTYHISSYPKRQDTLKSGPAGLRVTEGLHRGRVKDMQSIWLRAQLLRNHGIYGLALIYGAVLMSWNLDLPMRSHGESWAPHSWIALFFAIYWVPVQPRAWNKATYGWSISVLSHNPWISTSYVALGMCQNWVPPKVDENDQNVWYHHGQSLDTLPYPAQKMILLVG